MQTSFFHILPGTRWVQIRTNSGHRVYTGGERFLVIAELGDGELLCWRDGIAPPHPRIRGSLIHERFTTEVTS